MQNVLKHHQVTASLFAHAGHGQLHLRPFLDLSDPADVARMAQLATNLYEEVLAVGGTISGEHASGLSRTPFMRQQYGPLVDVFREVKRIFDPLEILNPGKIFSDDPELLTRNLRQTAINLPAKAHENGRSASGRRRRPAGGAHGAAPRQAAVALDDGRRRASRPAIATAAAPAVRNCPTCGCVRFFASPRPKKPRRGPRRT